MKKTDEQKHWEEVLEQEGFGMSEGSLGGPDQQVAARIYLETNAIQIVPSTELPKGFSTSDELSEQYIEEASKK